MARGRLIWPFLAELARLDTASTAADPDGAGPLTSGYDDDFREVVRYETDPADQLGTSARQEFPSVLVPCQVEDNAFDVLRMYAAGNIPDYKLILVFHFRDLERLDLVDANGHAEIRANDRLVAIRDYHTQEIVHDVPNPPGLYVTESRPGSYGLSGLRRNLLLVTFDDREQGAIRT